jgi:methylthioribose-1-phosphate isomerase
MLVQNKNLTTIWYEQNTDKIKIIDQRLIPFELKIIELNTVDEVCFAIKEMQVRGAPLIGVTAAYGMYIAARKNPDFVFLKNASEKIYSTRPTAVNLGWALNKIMSNIKNVKKENLPTKILELANQIREDDINNCKNIGEHGYKLIKKVYDKNNKPVNILTHCNAGWLAAVDWGTALAPVFVAHKNNIPVHVWVDETRPRNQGFSLTSWELLNENIPNSLIVDNVGGHLMQHKKIDICITGTDRTASNGDVCNKIGTYLKALAAYDNHIPFYVSAPISSIDFNIENGIRDIPIEQRDPEEVSHIEGLDENNIIKKIKIVPNGAKCANYAFDVTPAKYITKLITEKGVIDANASSISNLKK